MNFRTVVALIAACLVSACTNIPNSMKVAAGNTPSNIDDYVRFRTTLYFRSFDYCLNKAWLDNLGGEPLSAQTGSRDIYIIPGTDTLYRFLMTGKAVSGTTQVRFESGTLPANVIDPFGAVIERNPQTGRPQFVSQSELDQRERRGDAREQFNTLREFLDELPEKSNDSEPLTNAELDRIKSEIVKQMIASINDFSGDLGEPNPSTVIGNAVLDALRVQNKDITREEVEQALKPLLDVMAKARAGQIGAQQATPSNQAVSTQCTNGPARRGFQIMGPEGWRTFKQDERLIMAMSSSAKPLIQSLQRVSNNVLNTSMPESEILLPLVRESLSIQVAEAALSNSENTSDENVMATLTAVRSEFGGQ